MLSLSRLRGLKIAAFSVLLFSLLGVLALAQNSPLDKQVSSVLPDAQTLYLDLHQHPELSSHETRTAAELANRLRTLGYEVTEHVGGTGVVAILKNGAGPTVMLRTELDALPVEEKTGLPYASKVRTKDDSGRDVGVMHACGHDVHMAALFGTASIMAHNKDSWHGTLMLIGQPAEETITGADKMIKDGLFTRFPKPDIGIALHDTNNLPVGKVGITPGYAKADADSVRITVYGKGGHGAQPHTTIDPVLIAARIAVTVQSIVAREIKPGEPAVITIGYIQAGTKNNIIPDDAQMGLTVRSFKPEVRQHLLAAIERVAKGEAMAAGAEKMPLVEKYESTGAVYNDPVLTKHLAATLEDVSGQGNCGDGRPDHDVRRLRLLCGAGNTIVLFHAWRCRSTEAGGSEGCGTAVAQQSLAVVRPCCRTFNQDRHDCRGNDSARSAERNAGGREEVHPAADRELTFPKVPSEARDGYSNGELQVNP